MDYIPKHLLSDDIIFHYTPANTAIQNILFENRLRLSSRVKSNDPVEKISFRQEMVSGGENEELRKFGWTFIKNLKQMVSVCTQICFCKSYQDDHMAKYLGSEIDSFGFLKPRMWDQYSDGYKGVCLAFSKMELLKDSVLRNDDVKYLSYTEMEEQQLRFNIRGMTEENKSKFTLKFHDNVLNSLFKKHKDYEGENEFRVCSFSDNEYDWLEIKDSLKAIIVSPQFVNKYSMDFLNSYCEKLPVDLIEIYWDNKGVRIRSTKKENELQSKMQEMVNKNNSLE